MGCTAVQITHWVVTLSTCFALSNPVFSFRAKYSGFTMECLEFDTTFLTVPFLCAIFTLVLSLIMQIGANSLSFIADTYPSSTVYATSESVTEPKIRSLSWKKSVGLTFLRFLDIYATHASSQYSIFTSIVTFAGFHSTSPYVNAIWAQVSNLCSDVT